MVRYLTVAAALAAFCGANALGQDLWPSHGTWDSFSSFVEDSPQLKDASSLSFDWLEHYGQSAPADFGDLLVRGQDGGGSSGGAGAADAVNPAVPLTQLQLQNLFIPNTYDSSGYSNQFILQPVLPFNINEDGFIPYHIMRPTLPIIAPTADPDGAVGVQGGLGDLTVADVFVHPMEELKTSIGGGWTAILPTSTDPQLGLGEWQLGPAAFVITRAVPNWVVGALYQMPFSTQSDAYSGQAQLIATRLLENQWYVGWGDQLWTVDDQNGNYNLPLQARVGKVVKVGRQPINIFLQGFYTPEDMRRGPAAEWGIKLSVAFLFPEAKLPAPILSRLMCL